MTKKKDVADGKYGEKILYDFPFIDRKNWELEMETDDG